MVIITRIVIHRHIINISHWHTYQYSYLNYEYYDSTYIENRIDIKCEKTFSLIKSKIFYNFLFEYDMINFLNDCKYNSQFKLFNQLMNDSFYL